MPLMATPVPTTLATASVESALPSRSSASTSGGRSPRAQTFSALRSLTPQETLMDTVEEMRKQGGFQNVSQSKSFRSDADTTHADIRTK